MIGPDAYYKSHCKLPTIGEQGQDILNNSKLLVIGAGGLGCPCLQYLTGCGIGTIGIADFDKISVENLHRQILYTADDVGAYKTSVAIKRLGAQNPLITLIEHRQYVDETNILPLLQEYDIIVDATDNFQVRYLINDACVFLDKPLVYGAIHQTEGHVTVFNYQSSPTLRCLFPEAAANNAVPSCADIGAYNIITGIIGIMMANEVIKIITKSPHVLAGKLYCIDAYTGKTRKVSYSLLNESREKSLSRFTSVQNPVEISPSELFDKITNNEKFRLIDVREKDERKLENIGGEHIPLNIFFLNTSFQLNDESVIIYCQHGSRSLAAAQYLRKKGLKAYSLQSGIHGFYLQYPLLKEKSSPV